MHAVLVNATGLIEDNIKNKNECFKKKKLFHVYVLILIIKTTLFIIKYSI